MLKKDMDKEITRLETEVLELKDSLDFKHNEVRDSQQRVQRLELDVERGLVRQNYLQGQLDVLKRVSRLYQEEQLTRKEYLESQDLPF